LEEWRAAKRHERETFAERKGWPSAAHIEAVKATRVAYAALCAAVDALTGEEKG
jgi:hypothetical protein